MPLLPYRKLHPRFQPPRAAFAIRPGSPSAFAHRQIVGRLPRELILTSCGLTECSRFSSARPGANRHAHDKAKRRIAVVGHDLAPCERRQRGEVRGQALLQLGLERTVFRVAAGRTVHIDAIARAIAAGAELRELLQAHPQRDGGGPGVALVPGWIASQVLGHHDASWIHGINAQGVPLCSNHTQRELIQIDIPEGQEESPAAE